MPLILIEKDDEAEFLVGRRSVPNLVGRDYVGSGELLDPSQKNLACNLASPRLWRGGSFIET